MLTQSTPVQHRGCDMTDADLASQSSDDQLRRHIPKRAVTFHSKLVQP